MSCEAQEYSGMVILLFVLLMSALISVNCSITDLLQQNTRSMPVQMDMETENAITICTGDKKTVGCRDGANMAITNAFWGRLSDKVCPSDDGDPVTDCDKSADTLEIVRGYCQGQKECDLVAKHEKLQKNGTSHCPGVNKYLNLTYTCIPESRGVTLCQDVATTLSCAAGWVMELADVFWGRRANSVATCGDEDGVECDNSEWASKYLKNKCNKKKKCHVKADPDVLSNKKSTPCVGKYLMVNYICRPPISGENNIDIMKDDTKPVQEASSKELMGLLEKHLTEIKEPAPVIKLKAEDPIKDVFSAARPVNQQQQQQPQMPVVTPVYNTISNMNVPQSGIGIAHIRSNTESKVKNPEKSNTLIEGDKNIPVKSKSHMSEVPSTGMEDDDSTSVRSILTRAKDILKTLDMDGNKENKESLIRKRENIARPNTSTKKASKISTKVSQKLNPSVKSQKRSGIPIYQNNYPASFRLRSWYGK